MNCCKVIEEISMLHGDVFPRVVDVFPALPRRRNSTGNVSSHHLLKGMHRNAQGSVPMKKGSVLKTRWNIGKYRISKKHTTHATPF
jgi:hypothetical protein